MRSPEEVKSDIDSIAAICRILREISEELGYQGELNRSVVREFLSRKPEFEFDHRLVMIIEWLLSGGKTAFLQDTNSLIVPTAKLVVILIYLRETFPSLIRVTSYARSKTLFSKRQEDLSAIRNAGLDRLHVGLESGDDEVLRLI